MISENSSLLLLTLLFSDRASRASWPPPIAAVKPDKPATAAPRPAPRFLGRTLRASYELGSAFAVLCVQTGLDGKYLVVLRSRFLHQNIGGLRHAQSLQRFLQRRFEIGHGERAPLPLHRSSSGARMSRRINSRAGSISAVQINRRQDRFQRINQQRRLAAPSAFFLAPAQPQVVAQLKLLSYSNQMPFTDHVGAQF